MLPTTTDGPRRLILWVSAVAAVAFGTSSLGAQETEAATAAAQEAPASEVAVADDDDPNRFRFELPVPADQGGGTVVGSADSVESDGQGLSILVGDVVIRYKDLTVQADRIEYDGEMARVYATGGVIFDQGPQRLTGDSVEYNLETELGRFTNTSGSLSGDYYFKGSVVEKVSDTRFIIEDGEFTACEGEDPSWSFRAAHIRVTQDKYARVKNARFRAGKVPVLYMPYMLWPVKESRTSGFLMPKPGYSSRRGASLSLAYFQALGRSYDVTLSADIFAGGSLDENAQGTGEFLGFGQEFRYRPSETTEGFFEGYVIRDPEFDDTRWKINFSHTSRDLPGGFRGVVKYEDVSDFDYFRDYERRGDNNTRRQLYSQGFLTKNKGSHSFNLKFDNRQTLVGTNADGTDRFVELSQLPELEYKLRSTRIGRTPLYLELESSAHMLDASRSERQDESYGRADVFPTLTLPVRIAPWLSMSMSAGARYTWYSDSLYLDSEKDGTDSDFRGESLDRFTPFASAEMIGPSFSRIFDLKGTSFSRMKHIIEPRVTYVFRDEFDDENRIARFDEVDRIQGNNSARYSIVNRLLAKPRNEDLGGAREILSLTIFQDHSFDEDRPLQRSSDRTETKSLGPLSALFLYNPSRSTNVRVDLAYNTLFGGLQSTSVSSSVRFRDRDRIGLRWTTRRDVELDSTQAHQVRLSTSVGFGQRWTWTGEINYDVERSLKQLQRYFLDFKARCFGLTFEAGDYRIGNRRDVQYRFLLNLKNVGTFLDINGGSSEDL